MAALEPLIRFERLQGSWRTSNPVHAPARDVSGRKWAQIDALAGLALDALEGVDEVWDWCAGKAHLGRLIGMHSGVRVLALERDPTLCAAAQRLAQRDGIRLTVRVCDVLIESTEPTPTTLICALHACGDLHLTLLDRVGRQSPAGLLLAPCCYHRTVHEHHRPRSSAGRACGLRLSREDLRLAVLETCTAGRAQRETEKRRKARLLALKGWGAQHGLEVKDYSSLKDIGRGDECMALQRACERLGWPLPDAGQVEAVMRTGWRRSSEVRAFELIRTAVRRPLEVWLVLDMALGLADEGYEVEVGEFCGRELTPRNLMIRAGSRPGWGGGGNAPGWP
ncbi:MAG: methyltransferase [Halothiobacillaceae bacterium]